MATPAWTGGENDLPLMSNTSQVLVRHYILDLECDLEKQTFSGSIALFLDLSKHGEDKRVFSIQEFQNVVYKIDETENSAPHVKTCLSSPSEVQDITEKNLGIASGTNVIQESDTERQNLSQSPFELVLDCCEINVKKVEKLLPSDHAPMAMCDLQKLFQKQLKNSAVQLREISKLPGQVITHRTDQWSLRINDPDVTKPCDFPPVIRVTYQTQPRGRSLRWVNDQDGNPCVYTAGMWINNRSFLPCQEYGSLSTWHAYVRAPIPWRVFMSGDEVERFTECDGGLMEYEYWSSMPLPSFTLAIAIGKWEIVTIHDAKNLENGTCGESSSRDEQTLSTYLKGTCEHEDPCNITFSETPCIDCRIIAPTSKIQAAIREFAAEFPKYCTAVQKILGPLPFQRMDIILYPPSCQDLAMCNPNLLFMSQTTLAGDQSMCVRLGHELSHYWFGLLIGARDWTEEWLSEGFATYVEDFVQAEVLDEVDEQRGWDHQELTSYIRYKTLAAEVAHTSSELQTLRPNQGQGLAASLNDKSVMFIKNGNNPHKLFTQVHYLKGYFLLRWLGKQVGVQHFLAVFRDYVVHHHGEMVKSKDFLTLVFAKFPQLANKGYSVESVCAEWLDGVGLPEALRDFSPSESNQLYRDVMDEASNWKSRDRSNQRMKSLGKRRKSNKDEPRELSPAQMILLLDNLLEKKSFLAATLRQLNCYKFSSRNAEVQHRWLELVVKHLFVPCYGELEHFLLHHQAMGIYLYGEMMISRCPKLRDIAHRCFSKVKDDMETSTRNMVQTMLFGS